MNDSRTAAPGSETPSLFMALLIGAAALLWLAATEPFDQGYRKPAELAAAMLASGDWVAQRFAGGRLYFDKPPMLTWLVAVVARFTSGPISWEQHVPGLLAWVLMLGWTGLLARRWLGTTRAALIAALVLATTFGFPTLIRTKRLDPIFAAFTTGAIYYAYHALVAEGHGVRRAAASVGAWLFTALALLTKGPIALVVVFGTIVAFAAWTSRLRRLATGANLVGALLCVAVVVSWPLLLFHDLGVEQVLATLRDTDLTTRRGGPLFYLTNVPVRMLPWVLLVPALFVWRGGTPEQRRSDAWRLSLCWFLAVFVPLQFSHAKHYRYLLPAYPAFALLVTALVHDERLAGWGRTLRDGVIGLALALLLCAAVGAPIAAAVAGARSPIGPGLAVLFALPVGAWAWLGVAALRRGRALRAFAFALCAASVAYAAEMASLALIYRSWDATHVVRAAFVDPVEAGVAGRSFGLDDKGEGLVLIATRRSVPQAEDVDAVAAWLRAEPGRRGVLMTTPDGAALLASDPRLSVSQRHEAELDRDPFVFLELRTSGS